MLFKLVDTATTRGTAQHSMASQGLTHRPARPRPILADTMACKDCLPQELLEDIAAKKAELETMRLTFRPAATEGGHFSELLVERAMGSTMCTVTVQTVYMLQKEETSVHQTMYVRASQQVRCGRGLCMWLLLTPIGADCCSR